MGVGRLVMIKTLLLLPVRDNESRPFLDTMWIELELRFADLGGWQRQADVEGGWVHLDRLFREPNRQYVVALTSWLNLQAWLEIVLWARVAFRQEAVYIEVNGAPEIIAGV